MSNVRFAGLLSAEVAAALRRERAFKRLEGVIILYYTILYY